MKNKVVVDVFRYEYLINVESRVAVLAEKIKRDKYIGVNEALLILGLKSIQEEEDAGESNGH